MTKLIDLIDDYVELSISAEVENDEQGTVGAQSIEWADETRTAVIEAVEKLERDAARYRWLRDSKIDDYEQEWLCVGLFDMGGVVEVDGKELDRAIDAAMEVANGQAN